MSWEVKDDGVAGLVAHRPKARLLQQVAEGGLESAGQQVDVQHQVIVLTHSAA